MERQPRPHLSIKSGETLSLFPQKNATSDVRETEVRAQRNDPLSTLLDRFTDPRLDRSGVISWSSPVPSFGDLSSATVATVGLNPSNREFVDNKGRELDGSFRRFHTLASLHLKQWANALPHHRRIIWDSCRQYFAGNPYDVWFKQLDYVIGETGASYYDNALSACHLDLIPYATARKWSDLTSQQRKSLLEIAGDTLALLLCASPVTVLILNGRTVIEHFEEVSGTILERQLMPDWQLPRRVASGVGGYSYRGIIRKLSGLELGRDLLILGFNHNIQGSFGVTRTVRAAIRTWIGHNARKWVHEAC